MWCWTGKLLTDEPREGGAAFDYAAAPWYQQALEAKGDVVFTSVYIDAIHGQPVVTAAQSVAAGRAVIAFDILLESLRFETVDINPTARFFSATATEPSFIRKRLLHASSCRAISAGLWRKSVPVNWRIARRSVRSTASGAASITRRWTMAGTPSSRLPYSEIFYGLQVVIWPLVMMFIISFVAMVGLALRERRLTEKARRVDEPHMRWETPILACTA